MADCLILLAVIQLFQTIKALLMGWKKCTVCNSAIFITADSATSMGNVSFLNKDGKTTTVDKTWKFVKDPSGNLRIVVHPHRSDLLDKIL